MAIKKRGKQAIIGGIAAGIGALAIFAVARKSSAAAERVMAHQSNENEVEIIISGFKPKALVDIKVVPLSTEIPEELDVVVLDDAGAATVIFLPSTAGVHGITAIDVANRRIAVAQFDVTDAPLVAEEMIQERDVDD